MRTDRMSTSHLLSLRESGEPENYPTELEDWMLKKNETQGEDKDNA